MLRFAKTMIALGAISLAVVSIPSKAEAGNGWVVPALVVGGVALVAISAAHARAQARPVYVRHHHVAKTRCHIVRERSASGAWRRIEVCD
jgi:hypothetical protein